jgi:acyl-CoA thioesterase
MNAQPDRRREVNFDPSWWSFAGPQGGHVASRILEASCVDGRPARSLQVQFVAAAAAGPALISTSILREGRSATLVAANVTSDGKLVAHASVALGSSTSSPAITLLSRPEVPSPDAVLTLQAASEFVPFGQHLEYRVPSGITVFEGADAELIGWVRFRDCRPVDAFAATVLVDALPPALYGALREPVAIPTVDMTVQYLRHDPVDDWVLARITTVTSRDGWCVDDSALWSREGDLIAMARQTRAVLGEL